MAPLHNVIAMMYSETTTHPQKEKTLSRLNMGSRVQVVNSMLYSGRIGTLTQASSHPDDFWDANVILDNTAEDKIQSRVIGVTLDQVQPFTDQSSEVLVKLHVSHGDYREDFYGVGATVEDAAEDAARKTTYANSLFDASNSFYDQRNKYRKELVESLESGSVYRDFGWCDFSVVETS